MGNTFQEILNNLMEPGVHDIKWTAINYASGIYFVNMVAGTHTFNKKITLLK